MTKEEFNKFRSLAYPNTPPISHRFKDDYKDRWFRIHSLPNSKRYPDTENEWNILLMRQNNIITDLFTDNSKILLVTGEFNWWERTNFITDEEIVFKPYHFTRLDNIDLFTLNPDDYDEHETYRAAFAEILWEKNKYDDLLKAIANDETRALFISIEKDVLVAPYDGGIDLVLKDSETRDIYKEKYKQWLSERDDGL